MKMFFEDLHGIRTVSPGQVFKEAYALSVLDQKELFLEMIKPRDLLPHAYNEEQALVIYKHCPAYLSAPKDVYVNFSKGQP